MTTLKSALIMTETMRFPLSKNGWTILLGPQESSYLNELFG
jgi:hypothetical protein